MRELSKSVAVVDGRVVKHWRPRVQPRLVPYKKNPGKAAAWVKAKGDPGKAAARARARAWAKANPGKMAALAAKRNAVKKRAMPRWASLQRIREFYVEASKAGMQVDHIVPLQHPRVCGLHCEANLQMLTRFENLAKYNKFDI